MLAKLNSFALVGIEALPVEVEVDAAAGLPKIVLVGLPDIAVRESVHRIERALTNLGYERPTGRTVIRGGHNVNMIGTPGTGERVYRARTQDDGPAALLPKYLRLQRSHQNAALSGFCGGFSHAR